MKKRVIITIMTVVIVAGVFQFCRLFVWISNTYLIANVDPAAILLEYPEIEMTEKDKVWLDSVFRLEEVQEVVTSAESEEELEFRLSETGLDPHHQFPESDCLISASKSLYGSLVSITFDPVTTDEKVLDFWYSISCDPDGIPEFAKKLDVYKPYSESNMTFDNLMARYWNFDGSLHAEVPGLCLMLADMTLYNYTFPRAEILKSS